MHTDEEDCDSTKLILDLVVKHRGIVTSNHRLLTPDIPLDQFAIQVVSVSLTLM